MCALVGMFILTLPVPIIVTSFASYYKNRLWRQQLSIKRNDEAIKQAERVKEILISNTGKTLVAGMVFHPTKISLKVFSISSKHITPSGL